MRSLLPVRPAVGKVSAGELQFRNAAVTPGYWNAPEITERTLDDGWLRTGDAGYVDDDGDVVLVGRYKEMIRRRGDPRFLPSRGAQCLYRVSMGATRF